MKNNKTPELRFSGFINDWEQRKLGEITDGVTRKNSKLESTLPLTISAQYGLIDQNTFFNKQVASRDMSRYYLIKNGEFAYNKSYSNDYPWGAIKRLDMYDQGVLSTLYIVFKPHNVDSNFLVTYYESDNWHREVSMRAAEGARNHGLLNITAQEFFKTELKIPANKNEQNKIGKFFKQLNNTIALHQQELNKLKQTKQGFLQKMFPREGDSVPELRFPGFIGDWEQGKLGNLADFSKGNGYTKNELTYEGKPVILYGRLYTKYETVINSVDTFTIEKEKSVISEGNEVIVPASGETSEDISRASVVAKPGIILGGDLNIIRPYEKINPTFLALTISNGKQQKELSKRAQGKSVVHLHNSDLKEVNLIFPKIDEQTKIGNFFIQFDETIVLHQRELEVLKETKKAFLQKMFINT